MQTAALDRSGGQVPPVVAVVAADNPSPAYDFGDDDGAGGGPLDNMNALDVREEGFNSDSNK